MYRHIRDLREDRDLTQAYVANMLFVRQQTYSDYERGRLDIPTEILLKLSEFYGVSVDYLLAVSEDDPYSLRKQQATTPTNRSEAKAQTRGSEIKADVAKARMRGSEAKSEKAEVAKSTADAQSEPEAKEPADATSPQNKITYSRLMHDFAKLSPEDQLLAAEAIGAALKNAR